MGRDGTGIVLSGEFDVFGVAPVDQFLSGRDSPERFQQTGLVGLEGGHGRPGFRRPGSRKIGDDSPGSEPIFQGWSERLVRPLLAGRDDADSIVWRAGLGDGGRISQAAAENLGVLRGQEGEGGAVGRGQHDPVDMGRGGEGGRRQGEAPFPSMPGQHGVLLLSKGLGLFPWAAAGINADRPTGGDVDAG